MTLTLPKNISVPFSVSANITIDTTDIGALAVRLLYLEMRSNAFDIVTKFTNQITLFGSLCTIINFFFSEKNTVSFSAIFLSLVSLLVQNNYNSEYNPPFMHLLFAFYITAHFLLIPFAVFFHTFRKTKFEIFSYILIPLMILLCILNYCGFTEFSHPLINEYPKLIYNFYKEFSKGLNLMFSILSLIILSFSIVKCDKAYSFQYLMVVFFYSISTFVILTTIYAHKNNLPQLIYHLETNQANIFGYIISLVSDVFISLILTQPFHFVAQDYYSYISETNKI